MHKALCLFLLAGTSLFSGANSDEYNPKEKIYFQITRIRLENGLIILIDPPYEIRSKVLRCDKEGYFIYGRDAKDVVPIIWSD